MTLLSAITDKINAMLPVSAGFQHQADGSPDLQHIGAAGVCSLMPTTNRKRERTEEDPEFPSKHRKAGYGICERGQGYGSNLSSMSDDEASSDLEYDSTLEMADDSDNDKDEEQASVADSDEDMADYELHSQAEDDHSSNEDDAGTDDEHSTTDTSMSSISSLSDIIHDLELAATKLPLRYMAAPPSTQDMVSTLHIRRAEGWDEAHLALLAVIFARGQQAIMPVCFQRALNYMPNNLFTSCDQVAILESRTTPLYHSERHLTKLLDLGGYMRTGEANTPEKQVHRYLGPYLRWASKDAGPRAAGVPPVVKLFLSNKTADISALEIKVARSMQRLADRHTQLLGRNFTADGHAVGPPTLYSIVSIGLKVVLLAYNAELGTGLHTVATFTFDDSEHDVWNSIALALTVCHARDVQISIGEAVGGCAVEVNLEPGCDPDA